MKKYSTYEMRKLSNKIVIIPDEKKREKARRRLDEAQTAYDVIKKAEIEFEKRLELTREAICE